MASQLLHDSVAGSTVARQQAACFLWHLSSWRMDHFGTYLEIAPLLLPAIGRTDILAEGPLILRQTQILSGGADANEVAF